MRLGVPGLHPYALSGGELRQAEMAVVLSPPRCLLADRGIPGSRRSMPAVRVGRCARSRSTVARHLHRTECALLELADDVSGWWQA
jgi:hypothetical protein